MASLSKIIRRPLVIAAAVGAVGSLSYGNSDRLPSFRSLNGSSTSPQAKYALADSVKDEVSWVSHISVSKLSSLSFVAKIQVPMPNVDFKLPSPAPAAGFSLGPSTSTTLGSFSVLHELYQSAELAKPAKPAAFTKSVPSPVPDILYKWHLPDPQAIDCGKTGTVVVLLGWLGSRQKHLRTYAEWYTSRGYHAITFTFPMNEVLSYQVGGKAEHDIQLLVNHLAEWLDEEEGKNLVFHTFSNTGWLTYGAILEKFQKADPLLTGRIKGCIVDSAPVAAADPQVWASGFSAALLKKNSIATKGVGSLSKTSIGLSEEFVEPKPATAETVLLLVLGKFFEVVLNLPAVNKRLSDVVVQLQKEQPRCPQLYIYSSADRVIPVGFVESFIEEQRKAGIDVRACDFVSTPHVDHFRSDPKLYSSQLTQFLEACRLTNSKPTSD